MHFFTKVNHEAIRLDKGSCLDYTTKTRWDSLDRTPDSIDLTESPEKNTKTQKHTEKVNEDTSDNDTDDNITYETDELKKSNRKNVNKAKKKGRMAKICTMNIERKRLLKQRRERERERERDRERTGRGIFPHSFHRIHIRERKTITGRSMMITQISQ